MTGFRHHTGTRTRCSDTPDWTPLLELLGDELTGPFMWMGPLHLDDGTLVHAYKHSITRQYIHLGVDGRTFLYRSSYHGRETEPRSSYIEIPPAFAVAGALWEWSTLGWPGEAPLDEIVQAIATIHARGAS